MKGLKRFGLVLWISLFLTGCTGRELEERSFPSVITVPAGNMEELSRFRQRESVKYLDYSHTKAVILEEEVAKDPQKLQQVLAYFRERPEFALNMLIFAGGKEELKLAGERQENLGAALQDLYKNQPKREEMPSVTLKDLIYFYDNYEETLSIPILELSGEALLPSGLLQLEKSSVPA